MSRSLRIQYEGAWYHVMNRGAGRRRIFRSEAHRILFLSLLQEISTTFKIQIHAYRLLDTHYHLLVMSHYSRASVGIRRLKERLVKNRATVKKVREIERRLARD